MKLFIAAAFVATLSLIVNNQTATAAEIEIDGIVASVNGEKIKKSDVRRAVQAQRVLIETRVPDPAERAKLIAELESKTLETMIDRELIVNEFKTKMGGTIKKQYVDDDINKLVREQFGDGDIETTTSESTVYSDGRCEYFANLSPAERERAAARCNWNASSSV